VDGDLAAGTRAGSWRAELGRDEVRGFELPGELDADFDRARCLDADRQAGVSGDRPAVSRRRDWRGLAGAERSSRARGSWVASAGSRSRLLKHLEPSHGHVPHRSQQAVRDVRGFGPLGVFAFGGQPDALRHALALAEVLVNQLVSAVDGVVGRLAWTIGRARRLRSGVLRSGLGTVAAAGLWA